MIDINALNLLLQNNPALMQAARMIGTEKILARARQQGIDLCNEAALKQVFASFATDAQMKKELKQDRDSTIDGIKVGVGDEDGN